VIYSIQANAKFDFDQDVVPLLGNLCTTLCERDGAYPGGVGSALASAESFENRHTKSAIRLPSQSRRKSRREHVSKGSA